jgi:hypothetical protein
LLTYSWRAVLGFFGGLRLAVAILVYCVILAAGAVVSAAAGAGVRREGRTAGEEAGQRQSDQCFHLG